MEKMQGKSRRKKTDEEHIAIKDALSRFLDGDNRALKKVLEAAGISREDIVRDA